MSLSLVQPIARNLDVPFRIFGVSPLELAVCALMYALLNMLLQDLPLAIWISMGLSLMTGGLVLFLNRRFPPHHGIYQLLQWLRPRIVSVMPYSTHAGER